MKSMLKLTLLTLGLSLGALEAKTLEETKKSLTKDNVQSSLDNVIDYLIELENYLLEKFDRDDREQIAKHRALIDALVARKKH